MGQVNDSWGAEVLKPANDKRIYKCLKLSNELQVLLVSDAETDMVRSHYSYYALLFLLSVSLS